ncbi:MAG: NAD(P)-dependent oxidoreductase [Acidimicrobiales bacterium]
MGAVVLNMGRFGTSIITALERVLPEERFVASPSDDAEIVATLGTGVDPLGPLLAPTVRWVHVLAAGIDGVPLDAVGDRLLTCSRGASSVAIAEFVLASMLAFEKRLPESWITSPPEQWNTASLGTLRGRTLGLIGVGAIGMEVAQRARAFEMTVVAVRRTPSAAEGITVLPSLVELLRQSDHVVVAAPATSSTHHLLDGAAFAACKPGVHVVNVARGSLVDHDALRDALASGQVAAASLDVVDPEPLPAGHWLYSDPRVRLSPHISWSSPESVSRTIELFVDNLRRYRAGLPLHGAVQVDAGY